MNCNKCIHNNVCEHWVNAVFGSDALYPEESECEHFEPVVHGKWRIVQKTDEDCICQCSVCLWFARGEDNFYCPHCGADMRGDNK